jgi:hypothetical protein
MTEPWPWAMRKVPVLGVAVGRLLIWILLPCMVAVVVVPFVFPGAEITDLYILAYIFGALEGFLCGLMLDRNLFIESFGSRYWRAFALISAILVSVGISQLPERLVGGVLTILGCVVALGTWIAFWRFEGRASRFWRKFAAQRGWMFTPSDRKLANTWTGAPIASARDKRGRLARSARCRAIVDGQDGDLPLRIFQLVWTEGDPSDQTLCAIGPILTTPLPFAMTSTLAAKPTGSECRMRLTGSEHEVEHPAANALGFTVYASTADAAQIIDRSVLDQLSAFAPSYYGAWRIEGDTIFTWDWAVDFEWFACAEQTLRAIRDAARRYADVSTTSATLSKG